MSLVKANALQLGQSLTATNNFTWYQPAVPDGTIRLANGNSGSTTDILTINSSGTLTFGGTGNFKFTDGIASSGTATVGGAVKLYEATNNGTNFVSLKAPAAVAADVTWTLPAADGSSGQYLKTNGSGTLDWATLPTIPTMPTGAVVGTTDTQTLTNKTLTSPTISGATFNDGYTEETVSANTSTAYTISLANGTMQILTLTGNCTYTFPAAAGNAGKSFTLVQKQDATGSRTVTWPATVKWPGNTAPTITSTLSKADVFSFMCDGTNWYGRTIGQNYL